MDRKAAGTNHVQRFTSNAQSGKRHLARFQSAVTPHRRKCALSIYQTTARFFRPTNAQSAKISARPRGVRYLHRLCAPEIFRGVDIVGLETQRFVKLRNGLRDLSLTDRDNAEHIVNRPTP